MAASVTQVGGVITVQGDRKASMITIADDGSNTPGAISIQADNQSFISSGSVTSIVLKMGGGRDRVSYTVNGLRTNVSRTISGVLGTGHDRFSTIVGGNLSAGSSLKVDIGGHKGNDRISVTATSMDIAAGAQATFLLKAAPDDTVTVDWMGRNEGRLTSHPDGGGGRNRVRNNLVPLPGSTGTIDNSGDPTPPISVVVHPLLGPININAGDMHLLDLSNLHLGDFGLDILPDLTGILDDLVINPLDIHNLDLDNLPLGDLLGLPDLDILNLDNLGIPRTNSAWASLTSTTWRMGSCRSTFSTRASSTWTTCLRACSTRTAMP